MVLYSSICDVKRVRESIFRNLKFLCIINVLFGINGFSGFTHSAFALGYEAGINKTTIDGNLVPPGALVTFVQKGIQYLELEANLSNVRMPHCWISVSEVLCFACL